MSDQPPQLNPYASEFGSSMRAGGDIPAGAGQRRGMIGHVPVLGVMMIVQGALELVMGLSVAGYAVFMPQFMQELRNEAVKQGGPGAAAPVPMPTWVSIAGVTMAIAILLVSAMTIYSGINLLRLRGRLVAMLTLGAGLALVFTCYCFPTALALAIYGLITLLDPAVKQGFELRAQGHSVEDVKRWFSQVS